MASWLPPLQPLQEDLFSLTLDSLCLDSREVQLQWITSTACMFDPKE